MGSTHFQETEQRLAEDKLVMGVATECGGAVRNETVPVCSFPMPKPVLSLLLV